jgi:hypothetical protein
MVVFLAKTFDILFLREIHGSSADTIELNRLLPGFSIHTSYTGNTAAGGVAIILRPQFLSRYPSVLSSTIIEPGRILMIEVARTGALPLNLCNLHIVPEWTDSFKKDTIHRIRDKVPKIGEAFCFVGGDLNFPAVGEGRLNIQTGILSFSSESVSGLFETLFNDLTEITTDRHTRMSTRNGVLETVSRIDRWFSNLLPSELISRGASSTVLGTLANPENLSDHLPIILMIGSKKKGIKKQGVPKWIASHKLFPQSLADCSKKYDIKHEDNPFDQLVLYKQLLIKAGQRVVELSKGDSNKTPAQKLFWLNKARFFLSNPFVVILFVGLLKPFLNFPICSILLSHVFPTLVVFVIV